MKIYGLRKGTEIRGKECVYRIESALGQGGFGITYKVTTTVKIGNIEQEVFLALKELFIKDDCERDASTQSVTYSKSATERMESCKKDFVAEARRLANINHDNIVKINEIIEANNTVYYVMQYINQGSLKDYIKQHGPLSESEMLTYMLPIMDALSTLHQHKINHLDIKPANVMLHQSSNGEISPVLIDFGLSKHFDENGNATSTMRTQGVSHGYSPMEQYAGLDSFSPQTDIYALGATMIYCLTGNRPPQVSELLGNDGLVKFIPSSVSNNCRNAIIHATKLFHTERTASVEQFVKELGATPSSKPTPEPITDVNQFKICCVDKSGKEITGCNIRLKYPIEGVKIIGDKCKYSPTITQPISIIITKQGYEITSADVSVNNITPNHVERIWLMDRFGSGPKPGPLPRPNSQPKTKPKPDIVTPEPQPDNDETIINKSFTLNCTDEFGTKLTGCRIRLQRTIKGVKIVGDKCEYPSSLSQPIAVVVSKEGYKTAFINVYISNLPKDHIERVRLKKGFGPEPKPQPKPKPKPGNKRLIFIILAAIVAIGIGVLIFMSSAKEQSEINDNPTNSIVDTAATDSISTSSPDDIKVDMAFIKTNNTINKRDLKSEEFKTLIEYFATGNCEMILLQLEKCYGSINGNIDVNEKIRNIYRNLNDWSSACKATQIDAFSKACKEKSYYNHPDKGTEINLSDLNNAINTITTPTPTIKSKTKPNPGTKPSPPKPSKPKPSKPKPSKPAPGKTTHGKTANKLNRYE